MLYRLTPTTTTTTTPGPVNQASSHILITFTLHVFTFILLSHCRHVKVVNTLSGVAVLRSHCHGKVITGTAGGLRTPTGQPRFSCPHSSPPNQCLPTDTSRPFITFLTASVQPRKHSLRRQARQHQITPLHLRFVLEENIHTDTETNRAARKSAAEDGTPTFRLNAVPE